MARERVKEKVVFAKFCESWSFLVLPTWKLSSSVTAKQHIRRFLIPAFGKMKLSEIDAEVVQGLISGMVGKGAGRHYVMNVLATLGSILTGAVRWGHQVEKLDYDRLSLPAEGERQRGRTFTPGQVRAIIAAAIEPDRTLWAAAALTGLRSGELAALRWEDIDFIGAVLEVRRSCFRGIMNAVKSRAGNRTIPLPEDLLGILAAHAERTGTREGLVFRSRRGGPINPADLVQRRLAPLLKALGIPRAGLHAFRHAQSTALVGTGANVKIAQAQLGHSDIRTTLDLYSHVIGEEHRKAVTRASAMLFSATTTRDRIA